MITLANPGCRPPCDLTLSLSKGRGRIVNYVLREYVLRECVLIARLPRSSILRQAQDEDLVGRVLS
jgi:hypothetical protein